MKLDLPAYFKELLAEQTPPCVSIYMPTLRAKPPAAENPRRLGNLIRDAEDKLAHRYQLYRLEFMEKFRQLHRDDSFWSHPTDGLAIFGSENTFQVVWLQRPVREQAEVADSFHLRPLIRAQQFTGRYQVLCLSPRQVTLYEGNQDGLEDMPLRNVPRNIIEATAQRTLSPRLMGLSAPNAGGEPRTDSISGTIDLERFFRLVDSTIWEFHSRQSGLPLILCADVHHHDLFYRISRNPNLVTESIKLNPEGLSERRLQEEAWKIIEPSYRQQIQRIIEDYGRARAYEQGSEDIEKVAEAAAFSRIGTLLVDADKQIGGKIDPQTGRVEFGDMSLPQYDDVLDDIAEKVMKTGGQVLVMPHEQMPTDTGVAAIYRF